MIGESAFAQCTSLASVTIGKGLASMDMGMFPGCGNLATIAVDPLNATFSSLDGILFNKDRTVLLRCPEGRGGAYTIPNTVTNIGNWAFDQCDGLSQVTIPATVTRLGACAFQGCTSLTAAWFQGNAPSLDAYTFSGATRATVYYFPETGGWTEKLGERQAFLWNPQMLAGAAGPDGFGFTVTGSSNLVLVVEACTNLLSPAWSPVGTNTLTEGSSHFSDAWWTNHPTRFYRLRAP
jgi:hypothetical protein